MTIGYNSGMLINVAVPEFSLSDTNAQIHSLVDYLGRVVVLNFWSAECPWSERADRSLAALQVHYSGRVAILPVASNLNESGAMIQTALDQRSLAFALRDEACALADLFGAQTTPHAFVIDQNGILRYQGAVDDVTFRKRTAERFYVQEALLAVLDGHYPQVQETPAYGCAIVREV